MNDYQIVCFNGANRTRDEETTDTIAIHPITKECEEFVEKFCKENNIYCVGGVAFGEGHMDTYDLSKALEENDFEEEWTCFTDTYIERLKSKYKVV